MKKVLVAANGDDYQNYINALKDVGLDSILSLNLDDVADCDALLLPGGVDINPARYNEEIDGSEEINDELDAAQFAMLDAFVKADKPVIGICRGSQMLNVYFGGNLIQNFSGHRLKDGLLHNVNIEPGNFLFDLFGDKLMVNSIHHQGVGRPGKDLVVIARSDDNIPEAFYHKSKNIFGVQWHPERIMDQGGRAIYEEFAKRL